MTFAEIGQMRIGDESAAQPSPPPMSWSVRMFRAGRIVMGWSSDPRTPQTLRMQSLGHVTFEAALSSKHLS